MKNILKPVEVFAVERAPRPENTAGAELAKLKQEIKYCQARDGVRLAYAIAGNGQPLVKTGNWLNHLEYDWESPVWRHLFRGLARDFQLIRYDARGNGLSDWDVETLSLETFVTDLEAVVDAVGLKRFPLMGMSQGSAVAVVYAARHPERVSHLVLYGGFVLGSKKRSPERKAQREAMRTLVRLGWGSDNPAFRQMFTELFIPGATQEQMDYHNELQRRCTSPEVAARSMDAWGDIDISEWLPKVKAPTLVMHLREDAMIPFDEGKALAAGIPGARLVTLQGQNHLFLENEPATDRFFEEVRSFVRDVSDGPQPDASQSGNATAASGIGLLGRLFGKSKAS